MSLDETKVILGLNKDTEEADVKERRKDLNKILKFLIRQTYFAEGGVESDSWNKLQNQNFWEFLYSVGMFVEDKPLEAYSGKTGCKTPISEGIISCGSRNCYDCSQKRSERHFH